MRLWAAVKTSIRSRRRAYLRGILAGTTIAAATALWTWTPSTGEGDFADVVIVGAGLAGLGCALELCADIRWRQRAWVPGTTKVLLLEAGSRPGGRVNTVSLSASPEGARCKEPPLSVELGAQWIHNLNPATNPLLAACPQLRVPGQLHATSSDDDPGGDVMLFDVNSGRWVAPGHRDAAFDAWQHVLESVEEAGQGAGSSSLGHAVSTVVQRTLKKHRASCSSSASPFLLDRVLSWCADRVGIANALSLDELSHRVWCQQDDDGAEGEAVFRGSLTDAVVAPMIRDILASGCAELRLNSPVRQVTFKDPAESTSEREGGGGFLSLFCHSSSSSSHCRRGDFPMEALLADGRAVRCRHVVVAAPLGVLQAGHIAFVPPLPKAKQEALSRMRVGLLNVVVLRFGSAFWLDDHRFLAALKEGERVDSPNVLPEHNFFGIVSDAHAKRQFPCDTCMVADDNRWEEQQQTQIDQTPEADPTLHGFSTALNLSAMHPAYQRCLSDPSAPRPPGLLMFQLYGSAAAGIESCTKAEVTDRAMAAVRCMFPNSPDPTHCLWSAWCSNPLALGSYAAAGVATSTQDFGALAAPVCGAELGLGKGSPRLSEEVCTAKHEFPRVLFAGEHTVSNFGGTMHGAFASGVREARRILECYK